MYFKFHEDMRKIFNEDIDKHNILSWIIYNTNYQEEYNGLKIYQCYISSSTISKCTGIQLTKTKRLLKTLEEERFISYIHKSKSKYTSSIIYADLYNYSQSNNYDLLTLIKNTFTVEEVEIC